MPRDIPVDPRHWYDDPAPMRQEASMNVMQVMVEEFHRVDCYAKRLQMQERMTRQIATALETHLGAQGVAVVVRGRHSCMGCRGVKKAGATMVTSTMLGAFRDKPEARAEFLSLTR